MSIPEDFLYYWDHDRNKLLRDEERWVPWFRERIQRHFLLPLRKILDQMRQEEGWALVFAHSLFGGIEAMSSFASNKGTDKEKFIEYCNKYFIPEIHNKNELAEAFYSNFRCGLAHGFGIEKGGITFREHDSKVAPIFKNADCFWVDPSWLFERFEESVQNFLVRAESEGTEEKGNFIKRFQWFLDRTCVRPSI